MTRIEAAASFNAFLPITPEPVLAAAAASETRWRARAPLGAVDGLPATIKDNVWLKGEPTRRGSRTGDVTAKATADAPAVARLREQGAVFVGKTTLPEYGWIGVCHSPLTGVTRNPWNPQHTPGGSTGGGAVAALLGLGVLHLGTDGAGSLRIPAAFTGVFGMKPTYGRVPAYPPSPFNVLAHQGPIARSVADAALMLSVISGPDARDMTAWNTPAEDFTAGLDDGVRGLRVAFSPRLGGAAKPDAEIEAAARGARRECWKSRVRSSRRPTRRLAGRARRSRRCGGRERPRSSIRCRPRNGRRWTRGCWQSRNAGGRSRQPTILRPTRGATNCMRPCSAFTSATTCCSPRRCRSPRSRPAATMPDGSTGDDWIEWSPYTYPFNLTQQPAASVPGGLAGNGLPIGVQIVGPPRGERLVLRAARALEQAMPMPRRHRHNQLNEYIR